MPIQYGLIPKDQMYAFLPLLPKEQQIISDRAVFAIGAVKGTSACGILVFRADELTTDIMHLAVSEDFRRQGIANGLIDFICKNAWETGSAVLCTFAASGRDDVLCRLLVRRGDFTVTETEDYICRIPLKALLDVKLHAPLPKDSSITAFYRLPSVVRDRFFKELKETSEAFARGLLEERELMLDPLCLCVLENDSVQSVVFCQNHSGDILLSFAWTRPGRVRVFMALLERLKELLVKASDKVSCLYIAAVTQESRKLVDTIMPGREITEHFYTACWDMNTMGG